MKIVVSRVTGNFEVTAFADFDIIGAQMELSDFLRLLAAETGDVSVEGKLMEALPGVLKLMKDQTVKVVV